MPSAADCFAAQLENAWSARRRSVSGFRVHGFKSSRIYYIIGAALVVSGFRVWGLRVSGLGLSSVPLAAPTCWWV